MPIDFSKYGTPLKEEEKKRFEVEQKSFLQRAGEFIAPTTTGLLTGEKEPSLRTIAGAGLEVGSFLLPAGAVARGVGLGGKVLSKLAPSIFKGTAKATTIQAPSAIGFGQKATQVAGQIGTQAKTAAQIGGVSGAMFGAGRALGEEETPLTQVAGQAALSGVTGAVGGAVLAPAISLGVMGTKGIVNFASNAIRQTVQKLKPQNRQSAITNLVDGYVNSFIEDSPAITMALEKQANRARRMGGPTDEIGLVQELAEEGYIPMVSGKLARFRPVIDDLSERIGRIANGIDKFLQPITEKTSLKSLQTRAESLLKDRLDVDPIKSLKEVRVLFSTLQAKFGKNLTAIQVNAVRKEMNKRTKAFIGEKFVQDTADSIADATRERLDELVPSGLVKEANAQITKFFRMQKTASILNDKPIKVEFWGEAIGRFLGTIGGATLGIQVAGPGGLVVAGILANIGANTIATIIRKMRFNPQMINVIRQGLQQDEVLLQKLLKDANPTDKSIIQSILGKKAISIFRKRIKESLLNRWNQF